MILRFILAALILIANLNGFAQNDINSARKEMALFNYSKAAGMILKVLSKSDEKSKCEATLLLAECYRMLNDIGHAKTWYAKAAEMAGQCRYTENQGSMIQFYYAQALRSSGEYGIAKMFFLKFDSINRGDTRGAVFAAYCDSAMAWQAAQPEFEIRNLSLLNTPQSEFGTVFFQRGIIFASDRTSSSAGQKTYGWTGNNYLNLYYSEPVKPDSIFGEFIAPEPSREFPGQAWHDGPVTFNRDYTLVFINQTLLTHDKGKKDPGRIRTHLLKIFSSNYQNGQWSPPEPFFLNSDDYSVGHPALAHDGQTLYFVSDMPGGFGETDIWFCRKEGNNWSKPTNAGPVVNTTGKEMFPFVAANGDLYFASDGLPGFGGLDLFVTRKSGNQWSKPHNLGSPLNSSYDDLSLVMSANNEFGLFSSNRPGGAGSDDIYCFRKGRHADQKPPDSTFAPSLTSSAAPITPKAPPASDTLQLNKNYRLENIFYNFDKWDIRHDAQPSLDKLVTIMKEYPISIELGSHTDCRGSEEYNLQLSRKRAESAVQYIISHGISASRIVAKGFGKSQLINQCNCAEAVKCSESAHQANRRTEFRITELERKQNIIK